MNRQKKLGQTVMALGLLLLFAVFVVCCFDVVGLSARGHLLVPLTGYLIAIFSGVTMQFIGAAMGNMRFRSGDDPNIKPAK